MKKLLLLLAFSLPLLAQEVEEKKETTTEKVVTKLQDWDFNKYEAAHGRAHAKMNKNPQRYKREQMSRRNKTNQWIKTLVFGGVVWYVGYEMGKDEMKKGRKGKKPIMWAREDKK
tara:strand:+ start:732 stop:1076 length:345 start_codon:yes stop_codon:yes gene_type:complete